MTDVYDPSRLERITSGGWPVQVGDKVFIYYRRKWVEVAVLGMVLSRIKLPNRGVFEVQLPNGHVNKYEGDLLYRKS